ncbi:efflux RND transporter periplasmic adaptor subunit [Chitinophaga ginsengisoli]|uniref:Multidrug efflux pump subunit AcrA (Membrane-fusion protein) n=1 Tax=Chitinophaga ginsengisoli TaxID=363837 RepID=A0A2P8GGZ3_9BACT|nr:efflux RND transporter periplasmic adaptor subunit [Chitinophaga ginsengisoli]PSL33238.1 multidrug efflux pump subunit AcrA (membrane-fusion protein) [Chitinophaga ginsengisoli]
MLKKRRWLLPAIVIPIIAICYFLFSGKAADSSITAKVRKGSFRDVVNSSGELEAENTVYVSAPADLQANQIYDEIKIQDMVAEGSHVKEGDYIATLDPTLVNKRISDAQLSFEKSNSIVTQTALDTALTLREARDQMTNLQFQMEQKKLALELSKYEPPATIRQAEIDLEKAQRDLVQMKDNYKIKQQQAATKMVQARREADEFGRQITRLEELRSRFMIKAPKNGLLVYINDWASGGKKKTGSVVRSWDPRVAMLPDLSTMLSKVYINEVDISKIHQSQKVTMGLDAFPEVKMEGIVKTVANIGETRPGATAKVFEVNIKLNKVDSILKPGMTTSNNILISELPGKLIIPLEAVFASGKISYVYKSKSGNISKHQVVLGKSNDEEVIVEKGLTEGDVVYLSEPASAKDMKITTLK